MLSKNIYLTSLINLVVVVLVSYRVVESKEHQGVCNKTETYIDYISKTEAYSEIINVTKFCPNIKKGFRCPGTKEVWKTRVIEEPVEKTITKQVCCEGYEYRNRRCLPICSQICENGKCKGPELCRCNNGYKEFSQYRCIPDCENCQHGQCIAPGICNCATGYENKGRGCVPICDPPCPRGKCTSPNFCDPDAESDAESDNEDEYYPTDNEEEPNNSYPTTVTEDDDDYSSTSVEIDNVELPHPVVQNDYDNQENDEVEETNENSDSESNEEVEENEDEEEDNDGSGAQHEPNAPTEQICDDGYVVDSTGECRSICEVECHYGKILDGICVCNDGFKLAPNNPCLCEPLCEPDCLNGICVGNNKCLCEDGFKLSPENQFTCLHSSKCHCINGDCENPEKCNCWDGFKLAYNETNYHRCEPICGDPDDPQGCVNGKCVGTSMCLCDSGFVNGPNNNYTCYANMSCESCLKQTEFQCLPQCYDRDEGVTDSLEVYVIHEGEEEASIFFYSFAATCLLLIVIGLIALTCVRRHKKINYNVNKRETSPNNVYFSNTNGVNGVRVNV